jgi:DNA-binding helix-hairpin-helix protein with protein kinase domain
MTKVLLTSFLDSSGATIRLGKRIGSGGEGDVYEILPAHTNIVAKIYHKPLEAHKQEKLLLMARGCNEELKAISAWPTDVLRTKPDGPVVGFLMPRISGCEPIHKAYGPTHRKEVFPHADWRFLVRTAKNLAAAFYVIHKFGYVIGDVNEGNILVDDKACVRLIDCDSFQVRTRDQLYYCEVGVAQFTPPEIQKSKHFRMERTANHDNFGLSILIFQLLFFGRHPYSGVYSGKEDMPIEKAIAEFRFAYSARAHLKSIAPPPNSVGLSVIPTTIAGHFEEAFSEAGTRADGRPDAGDWWDALEVLEKKMRQCPSDSAHTYYSGLSSCPWCRLEEVSGVLLFLSRDSITKIDLKREWQKVEAIRVPGPAPNIGPANYPCRPEPLPPGIERSLTLTSIRQLAAIGLIAACALAVIGEMVVEADYIIFLPLALVIAVLFLYPGRSAAEKRRRKKNLDGARYMWDLWNKKWVAEAGDGAFWAQLNRLRELRRKYEGIEREYKAGLVALEGTIKDRQLHQFLACYSIETCPVPRLTPNLKMILKSSGIVTAADIEPRKIMSIPQVDNTLANEILLWREQKERTFLFDPTKGIERSDIQALIHKHQPQMKPIERELKTGIAKLHRIEDDIQKKRIALRPAVEKKAKELAQAEADFEVFSRTMEESIKKDIDNLIRRR